MLATRFRGLALILSLIGIISLSPPFRSQDKTSVPQASNDEVTQREREKQFYLRVNALLKGHPQDSNSLDATTLLAETTASNPLTPAALVAAADMIASALRNLGPELGAQGRAVTDNAANQLSILEREFMAKVGQNVTVPITDLGYDIQNLGTQLSNATYQLNQIIAIQRSCAAQDINVLFASIRTVAAQIKDGLFFAKKDQPRLEYFEFTGHKMSVVPPEGGQVRVVGFDIWRDQELSPNIEILGTDGKQLATIANPSRGASKDEVVFQVDEGLVKANIGKCLTFRVQPRRKEGFPKRPKTYDFRLPFCVPDTEAASLVLEGSVSYQCSVTDEGSWRSEFAQNFYQNNNDCHNDRNVDLPARVLNIPDGCEIVDVKWDATNLNYRALEVSARYTSTSVSVSGKMQDARCTCPLVGPCKHYSDAVWNYIVTPKVRCTVAVNGVKSGKSEGVRMGTPETQLTLELPKDCKFTQSDFEYKILRGLYGAEPAEIYKSRRFSCGQQGCPAESAQVGTMLISAAYTPGVATGRAQISARVSIPRCGY